MVYHAKTCSVGRVTHLGHHLDRLNTVQGVRGVLITVKPFFVPPLTFCVLNMQACSVFANVSIVKMEGSLIRMYGVVCAIYVCAEKFIRFFLLLRILLRIQISIYFHLLVLITCRLTLQFMCYLNVLRFYNLECVVNDFNLEKKKFEFKNGVFCVIRVIIFNDASKNNVIKIMNGNILHFT